MIDSRHVFEELSKTLDEKTASFLTDTLSKLYEELSPRLTKSDLVTATGRTDAALAKLAEAQMHTEQALNRLDEKFERMVEEFAATRRQLGGLSDVVGYGLENGVFPYLRSFAEREFAIKLTTFDRRNIEYPDGRYDEINIYAEGRKANAEVILIGEAKAQPSKKDVSALASRATRVSEHTKRPVFAFLVAHTFSPEVERFLATDHPEIRSVKSYEFELSYARETAGGARR